MHLQNKTHDVAPAFLEVNNNIIPTPVTMLSRRPLYEPCIDCGSHLAFNQHNLQVNLRIGKLPPVESNGVAYLKFSIKVVIGVKKYEE
jgi:hypothetical protein